MGKTLRASPSPTHTAPVLPRREGAVSLVNWGKDLGLLASARGEMLPAGLQSWKLPGWPAYTRSPVGSSMPGLGRRCGFRDEVWAQFSISWQLIDPLKSEIKKALKRSGEGERESKAKGTAWANAWRCESAW